VGCFEVTSSLRGLSVLIWHSLAPLAQELRLGVAMALISQRHPAS
jgi:hypothetical protein